jgi:ATP-dependent exoDNAse (exonuclease V) beta subunit
MTKLKFNKKKHTYTYNKKDLKSVTTVINQIFPEFDARKIAKDISKGFKWRNSKKAVITQEEKDKEKMSYWLKNWKESAQFGTNVHNMIEEYINLGDTDYILQKYGPESEEGKRFKAFLSWYNSSMPSLKEPILLPEAQIFDYNLGYAGTMDLIIKDDNGTCIIIDWKTNKDILKPGKALQPPFQHLDDSKMTRYTLQLSFYQYLMELKGEHVDKLVLVHLTPEGAFQYNLNYLKDDVKKLIEVDKNEQKINK